MDNVGYEKPTICYYRTVVRELSKKDADRIEKLFLQEFGNRKIPTANFETYVDFDDYETGWVVKAFIEVNNEEALKAMARDFMFDIADYAYKLLYEE